MSRLTGAPAALVIRLAVVVVIAVAAIPEVRSSTGSRIETVVAEAEHLAHLEAFAPARELLEAALRAAERLRDPGLIALCLDRIGLIFDFEGDSASGTERHHRALTLARATGDRRMTASILASIGLAHWRRSDYTAATAALQEALGIQADIGDENDLGRTLEFVGRVHFKKGEYDEAKQVYARAAAILRPTGHQRRLSIVLEGLGDVALERGFFLEALEYFEQAARARRDINDRAGESYIFQVTGRAYLLQSAYPEALTWFERALAVADESHSLPARALALYHMGIAHDGMGQPAVALPFFEAALVLKQALGDRRQEAWILLRSGDALAAMQQLPQALDRYNRASQIWQDIRDPRGLTTGLGRAADVAFKLGQYDVSAELSRRICGLVSESQPQFLAKAIATWGKALAAGGHEAAAREQADRAAAVAHRAPDEVRWQTSRLLGWINRRIGHQEEALHHYRESLDTIERLRGRVVASADVRAGFLEEKQAVYAETVDLLIETDRAGEALEVAERARSRAFLDLLSARDLEAQSLITTPSLTLDQLRAAARRTGGTILSYLSADERLFIWVMNADGTVRAASSAISRRKLFEMIGALRNAMTAGAAAHVTPAVYPGVEPSSGTRSDVRSLLRQLYRVLVAPIEHLLPDGTDGLVTIIPHGPLFLVSFATLLDDDDGYLIERHTLAYSPSISVLPYTARNLARVNTTALRVFVVGNPLTAHTGPALGAVNASRSQLPPLPGAEREAQVVAALYSPDLVTSVVGPDASEQRLRALAPMQSIIHLATHAVVSDDRPMESYLALAATNGDISNAVASTHDGFLTVAEIFGLNLRAGLVTLSACDTGLGRVDGEGVVGLSRAFIYAGAASVLVSLWRVADTVTVTQMATFYRHLTQPDGNKARALAIAHREMIAALRAGRISSPLGRTLAEDPLLWGAFVLVGEAR